MPKLEALHRAISVEITKLEQTIPRGAKVALAESCTGGLIAAACTQPVGASRWFVGGVVAYSNEVKRDVLGVSAQTLQRFGAVSEEVATEMCKGVLRVFGANFVASVTGIAGPSGSTVDKPVGTVCFGWGKKGEKITSEQLLFQGSREHIRLRSAQHSVAKLVAMITASS